MIDLQISHDTAPTLFCFGYGFSARATAALARTQGWHIAATARDAEKVAALRAEGVAAYQWPVNDLANVLPMGAHVLISAPPGEAGDPVLARYGKALVALRERVAWAGYLSTTAVYGDRNGGEVDETSELRPASERGKRRVMAEREWLALAEQGLPVHVFRLAGIYGPGRGPFEKVRKGTAQRIIKEGQVFGRIHAEDIANTVMQSIRHPNPGAAYNVTDDLTCPPEEVIGHAAELLGLPLPPAVKFEEAEMSAMARTFYGENKRALNGRIKRELAVELIYPTYREGLAAILAAQE